MLAERSVRMALALLFIIIVAILLTYSLLPYKNAFFGAFILFAIFWPMYDYLRRRLKLSENVSALLVMVATLVIVIIPLYFLIKILAGEIQSVVQGVIENVGVVGELIDKIDVFIQGAVENVGIMGKYADNIDTLLPQLDIPQILNELISAISDFFSTLLLGVIQGASHQIIVLTIMYFLLYYLFTSGDRAKDLLYACVPFNRKNVDILVEDFKSIVHATLFTTGIIAVIQGVLLTISFLIFGLQGAVLWGFLAGLLSFLPVVGAPIIWVPAVLFKLLQQDVFAAVGILIFGLISSNVDNVLRPMIQKRIGEIHPFVSLLGIFIGISLFGVIGIVIGPLLLTYFILMLKMFSEEYVKSDT